MFIIKGKLLLPNQNISEKEYFNNNIIKLKLENDDNSTHYLFYEDGVLINSSIKQNIIIKYDDMAYNSFEKYTSNIIFEFEVKNGFKRITRGYDNINNVLYKYNYNNECLIKSIEITSKEQENEYIEYEYDVDNCISNVFEYIEIGKSNNYKLGNVYKF